MEWTLRNNPLWTIPGKEDPQLKLQKQFLNEVQEILANTHGVDESIRSRFSRLVSGGYDFGDILHQIYEDFGYPESLTFRNFWNMFRRFGPAAAVCEIPVDITWLDNPKIDGGDKFNTEFEKLVEKTKLWKRMKGLDNRQRVGRYAGLFAQVKDGQKTETKLNTLNGVDSVISFKPLYESQLEVSTTDQEQQSENFGNPIIYNFNGSVAGNRNEESLTSFSIHHTRVIIMAEGADDGSIYGKSSIESGYNDLMDLRKVSGAGGEGFYQNTRNAPVININKDYKEPSEAEKIKIGDELDEFLNKLRKTFIAKGLEFNYPDIQLTNPKEFAENSKNNIAAGAKIPNKLIFGNQTGKLAGESDFEFFLLGMMSRRINVATEAIEDLIAWCVKFNVLPKPVELTIEWDDLLAASDQDKLKLAETMSTTNMNQFRAGGDLVYEAGTIAEVSGFGIDEFELPDETLPGDEST